MIALAAALRLQRGLTDGCRDGAFDVLPRWPLDQIDLPAAVSACAVS
jgi:N6-L-threonylcarbamoyladenine synthase